MLLLNQTTLKLYPIQIIAIQSTDLVCDSAIVNQCARAHRNGTFPPIVLQLLPVAAGRAGAPGAGAVNH